MNGMSPHGAAGLGKLTPGQCAALVRQLLGEPDAEYSEDGVLRFNELLVSPAKGIYLDRRAGKRGTILELIGAKLGISTRDGQVEYVNKWVLETQHVEPIVRSANGAAGPIVAGMFGVPRGVPPLTAEEVEALEADQRVSASTDGLDGPDQALPDPVPPAEATDAPDMPPAAPAVAAGELPAAGDLGVLPGSDATPPGAAAPARSTPPVPPAGPAPAVLGSGSTASRVEPAAARQANGHAENVQLRGKRINDPLLVDVPAKLLKAEQLPHQTEPGAAKGARQMLDRRAVQTFTAEALQTMTFPPLNFILPGLVPEGATLLVSRPKLGKSWLVLDLALATAAGRFTLGELKPASGDVLYLALEDGPRRLQRRLTRLIPTFSGVWPPGLTMATEWPRGEQGIAEIAKWIAAAKTPRLIIVDTLAQFRAASTGKQQIYTDDYAAISGLQKLASAHNIAVVIAHHDRKSEAEDVFDTVSGTLGLTGAADTILILKRQAGSVTLHVRGRDIEEAEKALQFNKSTCRWAIIGEASDVRRSDERGRVLVALTETAGPMSPQEIMLTTGMIVRNAVDLLLFKMVRTGEVVKIGRGLYCLPEHVPPETEKRKDRKKERSEVEAVDIADKKDDLSNLYDLSVGPKSKDCPQCSRLMPPEMAVCPECGLAQPDGEP